MNIVLLGAPGSGKGTQASLIGEKFGLPHVSTGDMFRENIREKTPLGVLAKSYIDKGQLCPDDVTVRMVEDRLAREDCKKGFLLDGFPRTKEQAKALDRILAGNGEEVTSVVSIMIPDTMIRERIHHRATIEGRADDARDETINNRIATYHSQTEPLIDYYRKAGKYNEIDGTGTIDDVREAIFSLMDRF